MTRAWMHRPAHSVAPRACVRGLFVTAVLASAPGVAVAAPLNLPPSHEVRLANGARVILAEKHEVPLISVVAYLRGGSMADPPGKEGVAELTASLLRKGAGKRSAAEIAALLDGLAARIDVGAGTESSYLTGEFMARDQTVVLDLVADLLRRPTFPESEFDKLKAQSIDERRSEKDDPDGVIDEYVDVFFYGKHPYARPPGGDENTLARITRDDVRSYYKANYGGDRLILVLAGDFDSKAMESNARARFNDWPKTGSDPPVIPAPARPARKRVLLVDKPDATQTYFWIGSLGVARKDPDRVALDLANTAYGGHYTSILNTALRIQGGLTYGARWNAPRYTQAGTVGISTYTKTESTAKAVEFALHTLESVRRSGIDSLNLEASRSYIRGQYPTRLETEDQIASALAGLAFHDLGRDEIVDYSDRIARTSSQDVKRAIQRVYPPGENLTFVFVGNASKIRNVVKRYGPVTEVKISEPLLSGLGAASR